MNSQIGGGNTSSTILLLICLVSFAFSLSLNLNEVRGYRLPNDTRPITYDLKILTNIHKGEFDYSGTVDIVLKSNTDCDRIVIHAREINISWVNLVHLESGDEFDNVEYKLNETNSFLTIFSTKTPLKLVKSNTYKLSIGFKAVLRIDLKGFHKLSFKDNNKNTVWVAATHFEATYARRAFPCYDEPAFKAKFFVTITHGSNYTAISNMPALDEPISTSENGLTTTKFQQTPLISVYNIAFVVSNYKKISGQYNNVTQNVYHPAGSNHSGYFALQTAIQVQQKMEDYLDVRYSLPKVDHISLPDHIGEAMENWGLIIYDNSCLLPYSKKSNAINIKIAIIIAHEFVHQWFGNLVTMKWWSHLWLNEGMSTFYSYKILELVFPQWSVFDYSMGKDLRYAWDTSEQNAVTRYVETEKEIRGVFGGAVYGKAGYIIQMFEIALTKDTFRKGVSRYVKKFQYGVVEEDDLFDCLQDAATEDNIAHFSSPESVKKMFKSWTNQKDYPLVTVTRSNDGVLILEQDTYNHKSGNIFYWIPITLSTASTPAFDNLTIDFIFPAQRRVSVDVNAFGKILKPNDWLILNNQQFGMYRVNYDLNNWRLITRALKDNHTQIHIHNRAQLIRDVGGLLIKNELSIDVAFDLLSYLKNEDEFVPWNEAYMVFRSLLAEVEGTESHQMLVVFARDLFSSIFLKMRLFPNTNETPFEEYIKPYIFKFACGLGLPACKRMSKARFSDLFMRLDEIDTKMEEVVYCEGLKTAGKHDFMAMMSRLLSCDDEKKRQILIECLASSEDPNLIRLFLMSTLDPKIPYTPKDRSYILIYTYENIIGFPIAIEFLKNHHEEFGKVSQTLWNKISFMRFFIRNEAHRNMYLDLLNAVRHIGSLTADQMDDLHEANTSDFYLKQSENLNKWIRNYNGLKSSGERVKLSKLTLVVLFIFVFNYIVRERDL